MSIQLTGVTRLNKAIARLKEIAEEVKENLEIKQEWLDEKSEKYQESDNGQAWGTHLYEVEDLIQDIENMDEIDLDK